MPPGSPTAIVVHAEQPELATTKLVNAGVQPNPAHMSEVPGLLVPPLVRQIEDGLDPFYVPMNLVTLERKA